MTLRQDVLTIIEQLSEEQLAQLLPLLLSLQAGTQEPFSSESSQAYRNWLSSENDIYDAVFDDELAAR